MSYEGPPIPGNVRVNWPLFRPANTLDLESIRAEITVLRSENASLRQIVEALEADRLTVRSGDEAATMSPTCKPIDPRSAILSRALSADNAPGGYAGRSIG